MGKKWVVFIGSKLKEQRLARGLSQSMVAKELGYTTPQFISNLERGLSPPPYEILPELAKLYDVDEDQMVEMMKMATEMRVKGCFQQYKKKKPIAG